MIDTQITLVGNVVADPRLNLTKEGRPFTTFRVASTPRRFDRGTGEWRDGDTLFAGVTCWRGLAENTATCLKKGQAVIVVGRLSVRPYETRDGEKRQSVDIDALAIGPDLGRAVAIVRRAERTLSVAPHENPDLTDADSPTGVDALDLDDLGLDQVGLDGLSAAELPAGAGSIDWSYSRPVAAGECAAADLAAAERSEAQRSETSESEEPPVPIPPAAERAPQPTELIGTGGRFKKRSSVG